MIRECTAADAERIHFVINEAAQAYKGVIPDDCWHEPCMPLDEEAVVVDVHVEKLFSSSSTRTPIKPPSGGTEQLRRSP